MGLVITGVCCAESSPNTPTPLVVPTYTLPFTTVGVVNFQFYANGAVLELLQERPDRLGCVGENALPAAQSADGPSANSARVETVDGHLAQVRLEQLGE